jgi:hypothetical protein
VETITLIPTNPKPRLKRYILENSSTCQKQKATMVEIQEAVDESPPAEDPSELKDDENTTSDGWQKLMGEDILMKVRYVDAKATLI